MYADYKTEQLKQSIEALEWKQSLEKFLKEIDGGIRFYKFYFYQGRVVRFDFKESIELFEKQTKDKLDFHLQKAIEYQEYFQKNFSGSKDYVDYIERCIQKFNLVIQGMYKQSLKKT